MDKMVVFAKILKVVIEVFDVGRDVNLFWSWKTSPTTYLSLWDSQSPNVPDSSIKMLKTLSANETPPLIIAGNKNSGEIPRSSVDPDLSTSPNQFPDLKTSIAGSTWFVNGFRQFYIGVMCLIIPERRA